MMISINTVVIVLISISSSSDNNNGSITNPTTIISIINGIYYMYH